MKIKHPTSIRLTGQGQQLLGDLMAHFGVNRSAVFELALRALARIEGLASEDTITVPSPAHALSRRPWRVTSATAHFLAAQAAIPTEVITIDPITHDVSVELDNGDVLTFRAPQRPLKKE